jgi:peptidyl-prolyl cis-trans isomerase B (cyclophilin B)
MKNYVKCLLPILILLFVSTSYAQPAAPRVQLETTMGTIVIELNPQAAPKTTTNFMTYVNDGFYDNTIFHRVIAGFMIQGGGFTPDMKQKEPRAPILNEADNGLKNTIGTIAMARTSDPHSATAQFFINAADNGFLDHTAKNQKGWGYCVFGRVVSGLDVVQAIEKVRTASRGGHGDVPVEPVTIKKATLLNVQKTPATAPSGK